MSRKETNSKREKVRKRVIGFCALVGALAAALPLTGVTATQYSYSISEVYDGSVTQLAVVYTDKESPLDILADEEITLSKSDIYSFSSAGQDDHGTITIARAFPVTITADGETTQIEVVCGTVRDALKAAGITLGSEDIVSMELDEEVHPDDEITVQRVTHRTVQKKKKIPFETQTKITSTLVANAKVKTVAGKNGVMTYTYDYVYVDGVCTEKNLVEKEVTKKAVDEVYLVGSDKGVVSDYDVPENMEFDENGNPVNYRYKVSGKATAYSARNTSLVEGCVAMDLSKYPRGTWLYIKSSDGSYVYGYCRVADTGTALVQGKVLVDCFFDTYAESVRFGAKYLDVYVLS